MKETTKLKLPLLRQGQINKEISINTALLILDNAFCLRIESLKKHEFPPIDLGEEKMIITSSVVKESFENFPNHIAFYKNGWHFIKLIEGLIVWDKSTKSFVYFDGEIFKDFLVKSEGTQSNNSNSSLQSQNEDLKLEIQLLKRQVLELESKIKNINLEQTKALGVNTAPDYSVNKLSVNSNNLLFATETGDVRVALNKKSQANTSSFIFQNSWVGVVEFGIIGSNDFTLKTSGDGTTWKEVFVVNSKDGTINFKQDVLKDGKKIF